MKKVYILGLLLITASLTGCASQSPISSELSTWAEVTWVVVTWTEITWALITGSVVEVQSWTFDSWVVPMASGSEWLNIHTGAAAEVQALIDQRNTQPKDTKSINEPDIDLMQQAIEAAKNVGK